MDAAKRKLDELFELLRTQGAELAEPLLEIQAGYDGKPSQTLVNSLKPTIPPPPPPKPSK